MIPVQRIGRPGQRSCPQRTEIHPFKDIPHSQPVPLEHLKISTQMMCQCKRLGFLQMGKSGHISIQILLHDPDDHLQQFRKQFRRYPHLLPCIKPHIKSHLIVPAAPGMKLFPCITDSFGKHRLHKAVDILIAFIYHKLSALHILLYGGKPLRNLLRFLFGQDSLLSQHLYMGHTALDILPQKPLIKADRGIKRIDQFICLFCKPSAPQLCHIFTLSFSS